MTVAKLWNAYGHGHITGLELVAGLRLLYFAAGAAVPNWVWVPDGFYRIR